MDSFIQSKPTEDQDFYRVVNLKKYYFLSSLTWKRQASFVFVFVFFFRDKGGAIGWNDQRLFCCARFFFFFTTVETFCKQPPKCQDSVVAYGWSFVKSSLCVRCEQEKKEAARRGVGNRKIAWESSRKHYPDLGRDASSVWNFCARFTDVISREN